jgi:hypothetical protein
VLIDKLLIESFNVGNALEERSLGLKVSDESSRTNLDAAAAAPLTGRASVRARKYNEKINYKRFHFK